MNNGWYRGLIRCKNEPAITRRKPILYESTRSGYQVAERDQFTGYLRPCQVSFARHLEALQRLQQAAGLTTPYKRKRPQTSIFETLQ